MVEPLHVDADRVLGMSAVHDAVAEALGGLHPGDQAEDLQSSHGVVASPVGSALSGLLGNRGDVLRSTTASGRQISGLLRGAADAYRSGDEHGAGQLTAAAGAIGGSPGLGAAAGVAPAGGAPVTSAVGQLGQVLGQLGQVVQSVGQLPGQLLGGLGGVGDAAGMAPAMDHSAGHPSLLSHSSSGHLEGPAHAGGSGHDNHHAQAAHHESRTHGHDKTDDSDTSAEPKLDPHGDETSTAAQELKTDISPSRRAAPTRPQD